MKNSSLSMALLCGLALMVAGGCAFIAGGAVVYEAASAATGTRAEIVPTEGPSESFSEYEVLVIEPFRNDRPAVVPGHFCDLVAAKIREVAIDKGLFNYQVFKAGGDVPVRPGKMLVLRGKIVDYQEGDRLKRAMAIGGKAEVKMIYEFVNAAEDRVIARGTVVGVLKASFDLGGEPHEAIDAIAREMVKYIRKNG